MWNITNITMAVNESFINVSEISSAGAYRICINENWSPNMMLFSLLNVITIVIMMALHKKNMPGRADRLVNVLFLFNVFALAMNIVIALGFKFLPV